VKHNRMLLTTIVVLCLYLNIFGALTVQSLYKVVRHSCFASCRLFLLEDVFHTVRQILMSKVYSCYYCERQGCYRWAILNAPGSVFLRIAMAVCTNACWEF